MGERGVESPGGIAERSDLQVLAEDWRQAFNNEHPHSALGYRSPAAFAAAWTAPAT